MTPHMLHQHARTFANKNTFPFLFWTENSKEFWIEMLSFPFQSSSHTSRFPQNKPNISTYWSPPPLWCNTHSIKYSNIKNIFRSTVNAKARLTDNRDKCNISSSSGVFFYYLISLEAVTIKGSVNLNYTLTFSHSALVLLTRAERFYLSKFWDICLRDSRFHSQNSGGTFSMLTTFKSDV